VNILLLALCVSAPIQVKAVYDTGTGNINVTWADPPGSVPVLAYVLTYETPVTPRKNINGLKKKCYEFKPSVLGTTYTIEVYADRSTRSRKTTTSVNTPTRKYCVKFY